MEGSPAPRQRPTAPRAVHGLIDELPDVPLGGMRQEAFESARKKFAMYGKRNAHVSHYSPDPQLRQRALKRKASGAQSGAATPAPARRVVDWDDAESASGMALQNTVLLQENGELAAQLDDMEYHLDVILGANEETEERGYAMASSVVALTVLLQLDQVQTMMKATHQSQQLKRRLREVLLRLKVYEQRVLRLSVAVMAFLLTLSAEADELFTVEVIDGLVGALAVEYKRMKANQPSKEIAGHSSSGLEGSKTALKKSCLKRKKSSGAAVRHAAPGEEDTFAQGDDDSKGVDHARAHAEREESLQAKLRLLLRGHDVFMVDGQIQLSTADLICILLHNILQVGGPVDGDDSSHNELSSQHPKRRFHQRQDLAGTTFATIMARKKQLIRNGGLQLLLRLLELRFEHICKDIDADLLYVSVSSALASAFQRLRTVLRVLDQASFLASEVQLQMSKTGTTFRVTLRIIEALSTLAWSFKSRQKWQDDPSFMLLVVDVLMSAMRVLINLSHQNEDANTHIAKLGGTKILFLAFCKLWGAVELERASESEPKEHRGYPGMLLVAEDKVVYDAMLLILSAITNCVEYSEENRAQLSDLDLSATRLDGLEAFQSTSPCTLLVAFFVSKVQSYIHLFEMGDSQRELEEESWAPEDVVLGGCASLLLGCLMKDSSHNSSIILGALPDASPRFLLRALGAFVALHSQIGALTPEVGKSVLEVEMLLKSCMSDGLQPSASQTQSPRRLEAIPVRLQADVLSHRARQMGMQAEITIKLSAISQQRRPFEVEEVEEEEGKYDEVSSLPSRESQQSVRSPPASAFRFQRFSRVCSNVDDSDDVSSDEKPSPVKKKVVAAATGTPLQSPARARRTVNPTGTPLQSPARARRTVNPTGTPLQSPARARRTVNPVGTPLQSPSRARRTDNPAVTSTPVRQVSSTTAGGNRVNLDDKGAKLSIRSPLKRTRDLVSILEARSPKVEDRVNSEINVTANRATSIDGGGEEKRVHSARELFASQQYRVIRKTPVKGKTERSKPSTKTQHMTPPSSAETKPLSTSKKQTEARPLTQTQPKAPATSVKQTQHPILTLKRKLKATPLKSTKKPPAEDDAIGIFDFIG